MAFDRWEWLEGLKPESAVTVAVKHVAKMVAEDLTRWPPDVSLAEGPGANRFTEVLEAGAPRPSLSAFLEAIKRARWDLTRDYDALGFYERNEHLAEACPLPRDQLASDFIQHYILESFFMLMERTDNRVKRKDVLAGVDALEQLIEAMWFVGLGPAN